MGTLVVMRYPTVLALGAADHTYVMCGTGGKAWACWGNKSGGTQLRTGIGSTERTDAIARPDEKAAITCYGVNGVCHQAANRILLPAGIDVEGARGAGLSYIVYGNFGRERAAFGLCRAPFNRHETVSGDLAACFAPPASPTSLWRRIFDLFRGASRRAYLREVLAVYRRREQSEPTDLEREAQDLEEFHDELLVLQVQYRLGKSIDDQRVRQLREIRRTYERDRIVIEDEYRGRPEAGAGYLARFVDRTHKLQAEFADVLSDAQYLGLLDIERHERVTLIDPEIAERALGR